MVDEHDDDRPDWADEVQELYEKARQATGAGRWLALVLRAARIELSGREEILHAAKYLGGLAGESPDGRSFGRTAAEYRRMAACERRHVEFLRGLVLGLRGVRDRAKGGGG